MYKVGDKISFVFAGFEREGVIERIEEFEEQWKKQRYMFFIRGFATNHLYPIYQDKITSKLD